MLAFQRILQIMIVRNHKKLFKELPGMSLFICSPVYPPYHSSHAELESMKIFVGIQTNCYANTNLLWRRTLSAGGIRTAAKLTATCVIGKGARTAPGTVGERHGSERWVFGKRANPSGRLRDRTRKMYVPSTRRLSVHPEDSARVCAQLGGDVAARCARGHTGVTPRKSFGPCSRASLKPKPEAQV